MFGLGIFDAVKIGAGAVLGALVASGPVYLYGKHEGRQQAAASALQRSMDLIRERGKTNAKINSLDDPALCRSIGGKWVSDQCE